jgi:hypothetical protein
VALQEAERSEHDEKMHEKAEENEAYEFLHQWATLNVYSLATFSFFLPAVPLTMMTALFLFKNDLPFRRPLVSATHTRTQKQPLIVCPYTFSELFALCVALSLSWSVLSRDTPLSDLLRERVSFAARAPAKRKSNGECPSVRLFAPGPAPSCASPLGSRTQCRAVCEKKHDFFRFFFFPFFFSFSFSLSFSVRLVPFALLHLLICAVWHRSSVAELLSLPTNPLKKNQPFLFPTFPLMIFFFFFFADPFFSLSLFLLSQRDDGAGAADQVSADLSTDLQNCRRGRGEKSKTRA